MVMKLHTLGYYTIVILYCNCMMTAAVVVHICYSTYGVYVVHISNQYTWPKLINFLTQTC
jgi:hypothetical protein